MRNDCNIVKDMLPLYSEGMLSNDSVSFLKEHMDSCEQCRTEFEKLKSFDEKESFVDANGPDYDEALPIKKIKRKLKKRITIAVIVSVFLTIATILLYTETKSLVINYGISEIYSQEDMDDAIAVIKEKFSSWSGCKLYSIEYTSDEFCESELEYCNTLDKDAMFSECIVFRTEFRSPIFGGGAWDANSRYFWSWFLARTDGGAWRLLTWGV